MSNCYVKPVNVMESRLAERCLRGRVVIIDDEYEICDGLRSLLEVEGYFCEIFQSANDYLQTVSQHKLRFPGPICILCDVKMPEISGLSFQKTLLEQSQNIPILLMSGASSATEVVEAFRNGVVDFLVKPIDAECLLASIKKGLALSIQWQQNTQFKCELEARVNLLTVREREIIRQVMAGKTNIEIGEILGIALRTVKLHRQRACEKLGVKGIVELMEVGKQVQL